MARTTTTIVLAALAPALALATAAPASARSSAGADACTGVPDCEIVSRADVDGDRARDSVGLSSVHDEAATVYVRTADGDTAVKAIGVTDWQREEIFWGAAKINRRAGHELVLGADSTEVWTSFRVLTYRDGRLLTQRAPGNRYTWKLWLSVLDGAGYWRSTPDGQARLTYTSAAQDERGDWTLTTRQYAPTWSDGWKRTGGSVRDLGSNVNPRTYTDWHIPYLQRYYG